MMVETRRYLLHQNGPALWPEHKPLEEVLALKAETLEQVWEGTYQGNAVPPAGTVFLRSWWEHTNRYDVSDRGLVNSCIARWISWDTGLKDEEQNAYSAGVVGELWRDYRLAIREVYRERLTFPDLPAKIAWFARKHNYDNKLRSVIIEDKASGTSAYQTLRSCEEWLSGILVAFQPSGDKVVRGNQAAVWCKNGCVQLPWPDDAAPWLMDFEDELFGFPSTTFKDQVDAFSQLILWTENLLAEGFRARMSKANGA